MRVGVGVAVGDVEMAGVWDTDMEGDMVTVDEKEMDAVSEVVGEGDSVTVCVVVREAVGGEETEDVSVGVGVSEGVTVPVTLGGVLLGEAVGETVPVAVGCEEVALLVGVTVREAVGVMVSDGVWVPLDVTVGDTEAVKGVGVGGYTAVIQGPASVLSYSQVETPEIHTTNNHFHDTSFIRSATMYLAGRGSRFPL